MFIRSSLCLLAALAFGGAHAPAGNGVPGSASVAGDRDVTFSPSAARMNWRVISFRGTSLPVPPGVLPLTLTTFLFGSVEVEVPADVVIEFNERGEAVFTLEPESTPHSFVVRVGASKIVAGARSRLIVPPPAVGKPRFESSPFTYRVPTPREFLDQAYDLGDPLDASPFR
jgi:hypothetical protein